jgi:hypothetical protein
LTWETTSSALAARPLQSVSFFIMVNVYPTPVPFRVILE